MIDRPVQSDICDPYPVLDWQSLATAVLAGHPLTSEEALAVLHSPDEQLLDVLSAAYRVRRQFFGNRVQLYFLMNAQSGLCPEDCGYWGSKAPRLTKNSRNWPKRSVIQLESAFSECYRGKRREFVVRLSESFRSPNRRFPST